jgi:tetratricopeptide (TPR) repeat protein
MSRWVAALWFSAWMVVSASAQQPPQKEQEPPEEDANLQTKTYAFNPLQATKEVEVGNEYFKKHSYKAAAMRFREATRWNPNLAEAWLRLGEAEEKRKNTKDAKEAYAKYVELEPEGKEAAEVRKRLAKLN